METKIMKTMWAQKVKTVRHNSDEFGSVLGRRMQFFRTIASNGDDNGMRRRWQTENRQHIRPWNGREFIKHVHNCYFGLGQKVRRHTHTHERECLSRRSEWWTATNGTFSNSNEKAFRAIRNQILNSIHSKAEQWRAHTANVISSMRICVSEDFSTNWIRQICCYTRIARHAMPDVD